MGVAEIAGFALCWLVVATLMLWGVFTEHKRGPRWGAGVEEWRPTGYQRVSQTDWIVVESAPGGTPEVAERARLIAAALLASRGLDLGSLPPDEVRTEVTSSGDGTATTRILVRAGAMHASRRHL